MIGESGWQKHNVEREHFRTLSQGGGDERLIAELWASERSWRLLALRDLIDACAATGDATGPLPAVDVAWQLLVEASKASPGTTEDVLAQPQVGIWVAHTLRRLAATSGDEGRPPLWSDIGYLHAVAAASAVRAGMTFTLDVPARYGAAVLPTVGTASVEAGRDVVRVRGTSGAVTVDGALAWHPPIRIEATAGGVPVRVELVDRDVYRDLRGPSPPRPTTRAEVERWRSTVEAAWALLVRQQGKEAGAIAAALRTITPLPPEERFRPLSASGSEAFGGLLLSEPDDALQFAVTLVHESQHQKLGALLHLFTFARDGGGIRCYAPWRDDPRPVAGLIQGVYAFAGIAGFWRAHRRFAATPGERVLAEFEFALWRRQTRRALGTLGGSDQLTDEGRAFVAELSTVVAALQRDQVPLDAEEAARLMALDHHGLWRAANVLVDDEVGVALAAAWRRAAAPPGDLLAESGKVRAEPPFGGFDARAVLLRHRLASIRPQGMVGGTTVGDTALIAGDLERARGEYLANLRRNVADLRSLTGLGLALLDEDDAAKALLGRPELVLAAARHAPGHVLELAGWLGQVLPEPDHVGRSLWRLE